MTGSSRTTRFFLKYLTSYLNLSLRKKKKPPVQIARKFYLTPSISDRNSANWWGKQQWRRASTSQRDVLSHKTWRKELGCRLTWGENTLDGVAGWLPPPRPAVQLGRRSERAPRREREVCERATVSSLPTQDWKSPESGRIALETCQSWQKERELGWKVWMNFFLNGRKKY